MSTGSRDLLITAAETNSRHGVGILLQRFFPDSKDFVCVRTTSLYKGEEPFGGDHHELCSRTLTLAETEAYLGKILSLYKIRRILCVPYYREEFVHAVLAKKMTGAPLCTYLMDDQNVYASKVPDHWVTELLSVSDLRLGISPELCAAYQKKFGYQMDLLPPLLDRAALPVPSYWQPEEKEPLRAAMIGNVWTNQRFEQLRKLLRISGVHLDWYGNGADASWLKSPREEWENDHIRCMGFYPEEDLVAALASYPFVVVPTGGLDAEDDNQAFSRLSLPSRLLFLHARTDVPVMILGSPETAAGRFVNRMQTGVCSSYDPDSFRLQVSRLCDPGLRRQWQAHVRRLAPSLVRADTGEWIWKSLAARKAQPADFQQLFPADYLSTMHGLEDIPATRSRKPRIFSTPGENFRDDQAASFGFVRKRHLLILAAQGLKVLAPEELELQFVNAALTSYILRSTLPSGGDVLFLGPDVPAPLKALPSSFQMWRIAELAAWQRAGYAGDARYVVNALTGLPHPPAFPTFDAIVSTQWCGNLGHDPHVHEGLSLYLDACTRPEGINFHLFTAVLHPAFFWTGSTHGYLRRRFLGDADWPDLDELLDAPDVFTIGEANYDRYWKPFTGKSYADFGKPLSLGLYWRKRQPVNPDISGS